MKYRYTFFLLLVLLISYFISGCLPEKQQQIILSDVEITNCDSISSSSGVVTINNSIYIVGDDTPYLYELNADLQIVNSQKVSEVDSMFNRRVPSAIKADFECMGKLDSNNLLVISSGSIKKSRDTAFIINLNDFTFKKRSLRGFFEKIKKQASLNPQNEINIEAVAITTDSIYFFHRGNLSTNFIATVSKFDFLKYFDIGSPIPQINIYQFNLPDHEGTSSGFSGACITPDSLGILFTASLEATDNEIYDGEVLGSFIGFIPLRTIHKGKYISSILTDSDKSILPLKLEGISVIKNISAKHEQFQAITVIDNDDGTSKLVKIKIQLK